MSRANDTLGVEIGARVELATNEPWQPAGSPELPALLEQLTRRDPGAGADLVIGLAGSPPTLVFNFHELGVAHSDGDHKG